ncbi:helix-turn-helix domain-containing protein [Pseudonocardia benzenivorans]
MVGGPPGAPPRPVRRLTERPSFVADEEEQLRTTLARLLRQLRSDAGITGVAAGERAGISQPMVSRWERGRNAPIRRRRKAMPPPSAPTPRRRPRWLDWPPSSTRFASRTSPRGLS